MKLLSLNWKAVFTYGKLPRKGFLLKMGKNSSFECYICFNNLRLFPSQFHFCFQLHNCIFLPKYFSYPLYLNLALYNQKRSRATYKEMQVKTATKQRCTKPSNGMSFGGISRSTEIQTS